MTNVRRILVLAVAAACFCWVSAQAADDAGSAQSKAEKKAARKARRAARAKAEKAKAKPDAKGLDRYTWGRAMGPKGFYENTHGDLASNLELLGQFKKPPEFKFKLYEAAYHALASKPNATYMDVSEDPNVRRICAENGVVALGGPMLGSVTSDGVSVWVRTTRPAQVEVKVTVGGVEKTFGPVAATAGTDLSAIVPVTGLAPATTYPYRVFVDSKPVAMPDGAAITTAPSADKPGKVRIVFGSCFHRWGLGNDAQAREMLSRKPNALLAIGDIAVQDRNGILGMHRADYLLRDFRPAWRMITSSIPVFATWDDHDYFRNDGAGIPKNATDADRKGVREVFTKAWANPSYGFNDDRGGIFLRTRIGPCDVLMTDNRYFRENKPGSFLGDAQMKWLKAQLLTCKGPFIVMSCGTMWSDYVTNGKDSWGRWDPKGREELFEFIEDHHIPGVLLISGDRHGARGFTIPRPGGFKYYEFEPGSLGGRHGPPAKTKSPNQLFGVASVYAFGEFTIDSTTADPTVTFRLIEDDGKVIYETKLTRSQLTPPGK